MDGCVDVEKKGPSNDAGPFCTDALLLRSLRPVAAGENSSRASLLCVDRYATIWLQARHHGRALFALALVGLGHRIRATHTLGCDL